MFNNFILKGRRNMNLTYFKRDTVPNGMSSKEKRFVQVCGIKSLRLDMADKTKTIKMA